jgi:hypothetical protein
MEGASIMALPNCLVIGAMRSGTSTLYQLLSQHPDVFMATPKEPNYFAFRDMGTAKVEGSGCVTDDDEYRSLFEPGARVPIRGEASHSYLYFSDRSASAISKTLPDVRLIAILRNPADRAFSHYALHRRNGLEPAASFEEALEKEPTRIASGDLFGHYAARGHYASQLALFVERFGPESLRVYLYEDLDLDAPKLIHDVYSFLGVDTTFRPDVRSRSNPSGIPRSKVMHALLVKDNPVKRFVQPKLPPQLYRLGIRARDRNLMRPQMGHETRQRLLEEYRPGIEDLQRLLNRDLGHWLK